MNWNGHEMTPSTLCASSQRVCADFASCRKVKKFLKIFLCTTSPVIDADQKRHADEARQHVSPSESPPLQIRHLTVERPMEVDEEASAIGHGGHPAPRAVGNEPRELLRVVLVEPVQHQERMAFEVRQRDGPAPRVRRDLLEIVDAVLHGGLGRQHLRPVQLRLRPMLNLEPEDSKGSGEKERECQPAEDQTKPGVQPIHSLRQALLHDSVS